MFVENVNIKHCDFACLLYSKLINKLPESRIVKIASSAVENEMEFVADALPVELIGMNSGMMCNYIRFCADQLLLSLGCGRHYKIGNPFEWMETISLQGKTNFFEKRVGEYSKSGVGIDRADQSFARGSGGKNVIFSNCPYDQSKYSDPVIYISI